MYRLIHIVMGDDLREAGFGILMNDEMLLNITNISFFASAEIFEL